MVERRRRTRREVNPWAGAQRDNSVDAMFASATQAAQEQLGREISIGSDADRLQVGLPLPALALRYLFQADVFGLSRIWQLAGEEGSCKTAMMNEILRWHCVYGGGGAIAEVENKDSPLLRTGILDYNDLWLRRIAVGPADSLEEWQSFLTAQIGIFKGIMDTKGGPGRSIPIMFGVDSLTAADTEANIAKTMDAGHASRGYGDIANLISRYMRQGVSRSLRGYPFSVVGTNHLKPTKNAQGITENNIPGGKAVPFMATYMVLMKRVGDIDTNDYGGIKVKMTLQKNSLGVSRRYINAELLWWHEVQPDGNTRQRFVWDWNTATIETLLALETSKNKRTLFKRLTDICDLNASRKNRTIWSNTLGIPQSAPVQYREAGALLESRPELLHAMYPLLGINRYYGFQPGLDYRQMIAEAEQRARALAADQNPHPDSLPVLDPEASAPDDDDEETDASGMEE